MKHPTKLIVTVIGALFIAGSFGAAAAGSPDSSNPDSTDFGDTYGMGLKDRYHTIHPKNMHMACKSCHVGATYADDYLLLDKENAELKADGQGKGKKAKVVDRAVCLGCHKTNGLGPAFYRTAAE